MPDRIARAVMESSCRQAMNLYLVGCDQKNIDMLLRAFAPDAVWERPGMAPMNGHSDIRSFFEAIYEKHAKTTTHGHLTRHCLTTISVTPSTEGHAEGIAYATVYRDPAFNGTLPAAMPEPELVVEYRDVFRQVDDTWLIWRHRAAHIFRSTRWGQQLSSDELSTLRLASPGQN